MAPVYQEDILVVDDTPENLRLLSAMLAQQGYNVRKAINGNMALRAVREVLPDLILLDIMMPDINGYEVCQQLKIEQRTADIPVIFISALDEVFDKVRAFQMGGVDYITKPFKLEEVLARIQNQLALKAAQQEIYQLNIQLEQRVQERTQQLNMANARLLKMALHDPLTELPNRVMFMRHLQESLQRTKQQPSYQFAVLFLDCDRFKIVNDSLGHPVGDELLIAVARRLEPSLRKNDILARFGGDEFAILLAGIDSLNTATQVAQRILQLLTHSFSLEKREVFINASIGITLSNRDYQQAEHLLRDADTAMYRAKALGKAQYHIFDSTMHEQALKRLQLETDLRKAIAQQEFAVCYQPIVDLTSGKMSNVEALIRWHHPQRGTISPGVFIPVAEETGLINAIGDWVMAAACCQLRMWQQQGLVDESFGVSVNLSVRQFAQPNLIEKIDEILAQTQLNPQCLKLEIVESAIMDNTQSAASILQQLRERKIELSIDDFGTGYSSLSYLNSFPVDNLKIDRSFIRNLNGNPETLELVLTILRIAETMELKAIAEGIETEQQLAQLRELNCGYGQGYLLAKPLPAKTLEDLIASKPQW